MSISGGWERKLAGSVAEIEWDCGGHLTFYSSPIVMFNRCASPRKSQVAARRQKVGGARRQGALSPRRGDERRIRKPVIGGFTVMHHYKRAILIPKKV
jgi:hypothetical protein